MRSAGTWPGGSGTHCSLVVRTCICTLYTDYTRGICLSCTYNAAAWRTNTRAHVIEQVVCAVLVN